MNVQQYLKKISFYDRVIANKTYDYNRLCELTKGLSGPASDKERITTSPSGDRLCNGVVELIEIENEIHNLINSRKFIISQIETLSLSSYEVLYHKYVKGETGKEIMVALNYSSRSTYNLKLQKALDEFDKLYNYIYKDKKW